jgi:hypothetical protein
MAFSSLLSTFVPPLLLYSEETKEFLRGCMRRIQTEAEPDNLAIVALYDRHAK